MGKYCNRCKHNSCRCRGGGLTANNATNRTLVVPVPGEPGEQGDKLVFKYQLSSQNTTPPIIQQVPNPIGWSSTPLQTTEELPYRWMSQGYVNFDGTELVVNWSTPVVDLDTEEVVPARAEDIFNI